MHPIALLALPFAGLLFLPWLIFLVAFRKHRVLAKTRLFGPGLAALLVLLLIVAAPRKIRFAFSRGAFDQVVANLDLPEGFEDGRPIEHVPDEIGSYAITFAHRIGQSLFFYEATGFGFDDAGFAYLPDGPSDSFHSGSFENPSFRRLTGDWYSWTASW